MSVIYSHGIAILGLPVEREIFFDQLGFSAGEIAVDVFFVASGFLVTGSLVSRGSLIGFLWARALRIYPALWVMLVLTVFVLAPALTTLSLTDYFHAQKTYEYFWKCAGLISGVRYSLPGVFNSMPLKGEFNGSLWTLPIELRMYLHLAAVWILLAGLPTLRLRALTLIVPVAAAVLLASILCSRLSGGSFNAANIRVFMFLVGTSFYLWRTYVRMSRTAMLALLATLALASFDKSVFFVAYVLCLAPLVLHLAYVPGGRLRSFNEWGDFSYGVYIYAFPIQQTLAQVLPGMSLLAMVSLSGLLTLCVAALSWLGIEKRALARKGAFALATSRALDLGLARIAAVVR